MGWYLWPSQQNPHSLHKHVYWKKRNLKIICEIMHATGKYLQRLIGPAISKRSFKSIKKLYTILLTWLWRARKCLFCFRSLNSEFVVCVCLQCGRPKQNCYCFLGKTTTIDKCTVDLRATPIAYLIKHSLVNILSQNPAL